MQFARHTAIGIDIGSRTVKAAQLSTRGGDLRIVALSMCPRIKPGEPIDRDEIANTQGVLRRQGFTGTRIVLAVPDEQLLRGILELPPSAPGPAVAQMARMELARIHHIEPQGFELVCWGQPSSEPARSNVQTVAVACPHPVAHHLLDEFDQARLDVIALDARTPAAARACRTLAAAAPEITAILDLGWSTTKLLLMCGQTVIYERLLKSDLTSLTTVLSKRFKITQTAASQIVDTIGVASGKTPCELDPGTREALQAIMLHHAQTVIEELKVPFSYAAHQVHSQGVKRLLLLGGGAGIAGLAEVLASTLEVEVLRAAPRDLVKCDGALVASSENPALTVAVGLALFRGD